MNPYADRVECELIIGTRPTLIAAMMLATDVQEVVTTLSKAGANRTATRLYESWQEQRKAIA